MDDELDLGDDFDEDDFDMFGVDDDDEDEEEDTRKGFGRLFRRK